MQQVGTGPGVSVIVPIYNAEKTLAECLDSLLAQTLGDIEIICVDDGSRDASAGICDAYAGRDGRIRVIRQENGGAGTARNTGLAAARGEYLAFQDADDLYTRDALEAAYARAVRTQADIVLFGAELIDSSGKRIGEERLDTAADVFAAGDIPEYIFQTATCSPWNKLYRRVFIEERGLEFQSLRTANDLCFVYSALACADRIAALDRPLARHRMLRAGNLQTLKRKTPLDFLAALEGLRENLKRFGSWELFEQSFVNSALSHCVHNYQTLDRSGKAEIVKQGARIRALLELDRRPERDYYNNNDYRLLRQWIPADEEKGMTSGLKGFLKRILPPPVNAFNREMGAMRQFVTEQNGVLLAELKSRTNLQRQKTDMLQDASGNILDVLARQQKQIDTLQRQLESLHGLLQSMSDSQQALSEDRPGREKPDRPG